MCDAVNKVANLNIFSARWKHKIVLYVWCQINSYFPAGQNTVVRTYSQLFTNNVYTTTVLNAYVSPSVIKVSTLYYIYISAFMWWTPNKACIKAATSFYICDGYSILSKAVQSRLCIPFHYWFSLNNFMDLLTHGETTSADSKMSPLIPSIWLRDRFNTIFFLILCILKYNIAKQN